MGRLAKKGDPYVGNDGRAYEAMNEEGKSVALKENVNELTVPLINEMTISTKRNPNELPSDGSVQKAINVILVYHLLGLTENETAHLLGVDLQQVRDIKELPAYQETFEAMHGEIISANSNNIQARIQSYASNAVTRVASLMDEADKDIVKLKASQDILDRSGMSADTLYGKNNGDSVDGFKIVVQDAEEDGKKSIEIDIGMKGKRK